MSTSPDVSSDWVPEKYRTGEYRIEIEPLSRETLMLRIPPQSKDLFPARISPIRKTPLNTPVYSNGSIEDAKEAFRYRPHPISFNVGNNRPLRNPLPIGRI